MNMARMLSEEDKRMSALPPSAPMSAGTGDLSEENQYAVLNRSMKFEISVQMTTCAKSHRQ